MPLAILVGVVLAFIAFVVPLMAFAKARKTQEALEALRVEVEILRSRLPDPAERPTKTAKSAKPSTAVAAKAAQPDPKKTSKPASVAEMAASTSAAPSNPAANTTAPAHASGSKWDNPPAPSAFDRFLANVVANFKTNWVIWMAAVSLAFGGIFIVQYGMERGFLGPVARVIAALGFGTALIGVAEFMRRRDPNSAAMLSVPAVFAAGGIASLFGGVVSAHVLYGLTGPMMGFVSMAAVAWLALAGGLVYGPVLAVIGILGAFISPAMVASSGGSPMLYAYFLLVLGAAFAVERWQRWIWLSALAVAGALIWGLLLHSHMPTEPLAAMYFGAIVLATVSIPAFGLIPKFAATDWMDQHTITRVSHHYPTLLAIVVCLAATAGILVTSTGSFTHWQIAVLVLLALTAYAVFICRGAQNLDQMAAISGLGLVAMVAGVGLIPNSEGRVLYGADYDLLMRQYFPFAALAIIGLIAITFFAAFWRVAGSVRPFYWALVAAILPLLGFGVLYGKWNDTDVLAQGSWVAATLGLAGYFAASAVLVRKTAPTQTYSADVFASGGVLALGLAAYIGLPDIGLTISFAALSALAYWLGHRFSYIITLAVSLGFTALTMGRLVVLPGIVWALNGELGQVVVVFGTVTAIFAACWYHATNLAKRPAQVAQFETAGVAVAAILTLILMNRAISDTYTPPHLEIAMYTNVFAILGLVQLKRAQIVDHWVKLRTYLGWAYFGVAGLSLGATLTGISPLMQGRVVGIFPADSLVIAYGLPALILAATIYLKWLPEIAPRKYVLAGIGGLGTVLAIFEIRRFWHGPHIELYKGFATGEQYTHTIGLLILTIAAIFASIVRGDALLRKIGLGLAAVTALKVFLWDMAGLQGLSRATAFIALGLTLAGIAWLHQRFETPPSQDTQPEPTDEDTAET